MSTVREEMIPFFHSYELFLSQVRFISSQFAASPHRFAISVHQTRRDKTNDDECALCAAPVCDTVHRQTDRHTHSDSPDRREDRSEQKHSTNLSEEDSLSRRKEREES